MFETKNVRIFIAKLHFVLVVHPPKQSPAVGEKSNRISSKLRNAIIQAKRRL